MSDMHPLHIIFLILFCLNLIGTVLFVWAMLKAPVSEVLPPQGAHGAYVEPEHVKQKREAYNLKRRSKLDKEIDLLAGPVREGDERG